MSEDLFKDDSSERGSGELMPHVIDGPITKKVITAVASSIINNVEQGNQKAPDTLVRMKAAVAIAEEVIDSIKSKAYDELSNLHPSERVIAGASLELINGRSKYAFDHDDEWCLLNKQANTLKTQLKKREDLMIKSMSFKEVVDDNGEIVPAAKIVGGTAPFIQTKFSS
jgi:hypothetical protein